MDNAGFSNTFSFNRFFYLRSHVTDNRAGAVMHYIGVMRQGHVTLETEDLTISASAGEAFYIPCGCRYVSRWEDAALVRFDSLGFHLFPDGQNRRYLLQKLPMNEARMALCDRIAEEGAINCRSVGTLYQLLSELLPEMVSEPTDPRAAIVEKAAAYMVLHPECSAKELARHCSTSQSGLYAAFQLSAGITPVEMKHRIQTDKAVNLLTTTDLSVEEISDRLGFSSAAYFRRVLHQTTGKTPREIRKTALF